ncbi:MAG: hypothetical protein LBT01_09245 [Spirochaetaceae bacterium]|nr:hypothetical protein [Spirochaetaceae bacterium]
MTTNDTDIHEDECVLFVVSLIPPQAVPVRRRLREKGSSRGLGISKYRWHTQLGFTVLMAGLILESAMMFSSAVL